MIKEDTAQTQAEFALNDNDAHSVTDFCSCVRWYADAASFEGDMTIDEYLKKVGPFLEKEEQFRNCLKEAKSDLPRLIGLASGLSKTYHELGKECQETLYVKKIVLFFRIVWNNHKDQLDVM